MAVKSKVLPMRGKPDAAVRADVPTNKVRASMNDDGEPVLVPVRVSKGTRRIWKAAANKYDMPVSEMVRAAVDGYLKTRERNELQ